MEYLILLFVALIAGAGWVYWEYIYQDPDGDLGLTIEADLERFSIAEEWKCACIVVIVFCAFLAAIFGASDLSASKW